MRDDDIANADPLAPMAMTTATTAAAVEEKEAYEGDVFLRSEVLARGRCGRQGVGDCVTLVPFRTRRVAVLTWSKTSHDGVRLAVLPVGGVAVPMENAVWTTLVEAVPDSEDSDRGDDDGNDDDRGAGDDETRRPLWGAVWSLDGRFLVVHGQVAKKNGHGVEPMLWVYADSTWMEADGADANGDVPAAPPLLLRVNPRDLLGNHACWPADAAVAIFTLFFLPTFSTRCVLVLTHGWLVQMDIQAGELLLLARQPRDARRMDSENDMAILTKKLVSLTALMDITSWHVGVTAVAYDADNATLVITGGLQNASEELIAQRASSLSVWRVMEEKSSIVELMDYTMVLAGAVPEAFSATPPSPDATRVEDTEAEADGWLRSVRQSLLHPLQTLSGGGLHGEVLGGYISHLALSPDAALVSLVDTQGRLLVRQIDVCADVLRWQFLCVPPDNGVNEDDRSISVLRVLWLSERMLVALTVAGELVYVCVMENSANCEDAAANPTMKVDRDGFQEADTDDAMRLRVLYKHKCGPEVAAFVQELAVMQAQSWNQTKLDEGLDREDIPPADLFTGARGVCLLDVRQTDRQHEAEWALIVVNQIGLEEFVNALVTNHQYSRALAVAQRLEQRNRSGDRSPHLNVGGIHRLVWQQYRAGRTVDTMDDVVLLDTEDRDVEDSTSESVSFAAALEHLESLSASDASFVTAECCHVISATSWEHTAGLINVGVRTSEIAHGDKYRDVLPRYRYRLNTFMEICRSELTSYTDCDHVEYDGQAFAVFRDSSLVDVAMELAREGRALALDVLLRRHPWTLLPSRMAILQALPVTMSPLMYAHLLPAVCHDASDEDAIEAFYCLQRPAYNQEEEDSNAPGFMRFDVVAIKLLDEYGRFEATQEEAAACKAIVGESQAAQRDAFASWFTHRMVELDSMYGQLAHAVVMGKLGLRCLNKSEDVDGSSAMAVTPFDELVTHSERLSMCVHVLQLPHCSTLALEDWSLLSIHDQVLAVVDDDGEVEDQLIQAQQLAAVKLDRLRVVFLSQRVHRFALDEVLSWLCQVLMSRPLQYHQQEPRYQRENSVALAFCSQLLNESNPSAAPATRWIQQDSRLLRTALDVCFAAVTPTVSTTEIGIQGESHAIFVDHLWTIFQSLPVRKDDDSPEIARLQVDVDGLEDLMVVMDVVAKYGIVTSPRELRARLAGKHGLPNPSITSSDADNGVDTQDNSVDGGAKKYAFQLVEQMCAVGLPSALSPATVAPVPNSVDESAPWRTIWSDAAKLKTHVFGERLTQESILAIILRRLLVVAVEASSMQDGGVESNAVQMAVSSAEEMMCNWVVSHVDAFPLVMDTLLGVLHNSTLAPGTELSASDGMRLSESWDENNGSVLYDLAAKLLALPALSSTPELQQQATQFAETIAREARFVRASELLSLLTPLAPVWMPAAHLRELYDLDEQAQSSQLRESDDGSKLLDVVMLVFSSHPRHYRMSDAAIAWLYQQRERPQCIEIENKKQAGAVTDGEEPVDDVVDGVLYLARLLGVSHAHDTTLQLTAVHAAIANQDFATAHRVLLSVLSRTDLRDDGNDAVEIVEVRKSSELVLALALELVSASRFTSWESKLALCNALLSGQSHAVDLSHSLVDEILLAWQRLDAVRSLALELGLSEQDVEARRLQDSSGTRRISVEKALLDELEMVVDLLRDGNGGGTHQQDELVLRLMQKGYQVLRFVCHKSASAEDYTNLSKLLQTMSVLAFQEARRQRLIGDSEESDGRSEDLMEIGFAYLLELSKGMRYGDDVDESSDDVVEKLWQEEIASKIATSTTGSADTGVVVDAWMLQRFHHFFLFLAASCVPGANESLHERVQFFTKLQYSPLATQRVVRTSCNQLDIEDGDDDDEGSTDLSMGELGGEKRKKMALAVQRYSQLAAHCQALVTSQSETQEVEAMSAFLNGSVDVARFAGGGDEDIAYRATTLRSLATTSSKAQLRVAMQFATKYDLDPYECVLSYITHAFFPSGVSGVGTSDMGKRQEQLESAFRSKPTHTEGATSEEHSTEDEDDTFDVLEYALQRPIVFATFLLHGCDGRDPVYEKLAGSDHIGILLVLRMLLECSKRAAGVDTEGTEASDWLPLSKTVSDRMTLLFLCLKRLKDTPSGRVTSSPDFKVICGAQTTQELLHGISGGAEEMAEARQRAVQAVTPFLSSGSSIKTLTKILQKSHANVSASSVVLIAIDMLLATHQNSRHSRNGLADPKRAYGLCAPLLTVLSSEHLQLFHWCFLSTACHEAPTACGDDEFYGHTWQALNLGWGAHFDRLTRVEIVAKHLAVLNARVSNSAGGGGSTELVRSAMENDLLRHVFWFVADELSLQRNPDGENDDSWCATMRLWFSSVLESDRDSDAHEDLEHRVRNAFVTLCASGCVTSLASTALLMELAFTYRSTSIPATSVVTQIITESVALMAENVIETGTESMAALSTRWTSELVPLCRRHGGQQTERLVTEKGAVDQFLTHCVAMLQDEDDSSDGRSICTSLLECLDRSAATAASPLLSMIVKTYRNGQNANSTEAARTQWKMMVALHEERGEWRTSALLARALPTQSDPHWHFGLRVKAVVEALAEQGGDTPPTWRGLLRETRSENVSSAFADRIFPECLAAIEATIVEDHRVTQTVALATLLRWYDELTADGGCETTMSAARAAWKYERRRALLQRLHEGFSTPTALSPHKQGDCITNENKNYDDDLSATEKLVSLWEALLLRGAWGEAMPSWYTKVAYARLANAKTAVAKFITSRVATQPLLALHVLLLCPFDQLRDADHHRGFLLTTVVDRALPAHHSPRLMDLLLLRIDLAELWREDTAGVIQTQLVAILDTTRSDRKARLQPLAWSSTLEFIVCRLVLLREWALAGRLVSSHWHAHPLLWDLEHARLLLANYLRGISSPSKQRATTTRVVNAPQQTVANQVIQEAVIHARNTAQQFFQRELTS